MRYVLQVVDNAEESTRYRLQAAEIVLETGLPKDRDAALAQAFEQNAGPRDFTVTFVLPTGQRVAEFDAKPNGRGSFSVPFEEPAKLPE